MECIAKGAMDGGLHMTGCTVWRGAMESLPRARSKCIGYGKERLAGMECIAKGAMDGLPHKF